MSREPEPWQTNASRPFIAIEKLRGTVSISSLGKERFRVEAPGHESEVEGYDQAKALAHQLAADWSNEYEAERVGAYAAKPSWKLDPGSVRWKITPLQTLARRLRDFGAGRRVPARDGEKVCPVYVVCSVYATRQSGYRR
jgi:hypothetical protein